MRIRELQGHPAGGPSSERALASETQVIHGYASNTDGMP
jgi:hypothetical protein